MNDKHCQSCGMPMQPTSDMYSTNADGSKNDDYCKHCFDQGDFTNPGCTMEQMIDICAPFVVEAMPDMSRDDAKKMMGEMLPTLKRWRG